MEITSVFPPIGRLIKDAMYYTTNTRQFQIFPDAIIMPAKMFNPPLRRLAGVLAGSFLAYEYL